MAIKLIEEAPRVLTKDEHAFVVANSIATWIWNHATNELNEKAWAGRVIGLYGGRGSGKTSVLQTALHCLRNRQHPNSGEAPRVILPRPPQRSTTSTPESIFAPAETRDCDDLLFALFNYIERHYGPERTNDVKQNASPFKEAKKTEVHRIELSRMLDWAKETATSTKEIPDAFVSRYDEASKTTEKIREHFSEIIQNWTEFPSSGESDSANRPHGTLILPIDDVDLQPHRTLELLELLHIFFRDANVVVIVAADRDLMLHSVMENLKERGMHQTGLAGALLAKYIPYHWNVPLPMPNNRFSQVWLDNPRSDSALRRFWKDDTALARRTIEPLLPRTYRGLVALHNRSITVWDEVHAEGMRARFEQSMANHLGLLKEFVDPAVSLCVSVDTQRPELNVLQTLLHDPELFRQALGQWRPLSPSEENNVDEKVDEDYQIAALRRVLEQGVQQMERVADILASQGRLPMGKLATQDHELPMLDRIGPPYLDGRLAGEARALLQQLAEAVVTFRERSRLAQAEMRLLAISLNADAYMLAAPLRARRAYGSEQIIHVDLREFGDGRRALVEDLRHARDKLRDAIEATDLRARRGQIDLVARVQLPLAAWLGAYLPDEMFVTPQQMRGRGDDAEPVQYEAPQPLQRPDDSNKYELLAPVPSVFAATGEEAILLIDPLRRSAPEQVNAFVDANGQTIVTEHKYRLLMKEQRQVIEPNDVVPMLRDIVEFIHQLHKRNVKRIHLGASMPVELAFFLGRELRAWGRVDLYEFYGDHYDYVFDLNL